MKKQEPLTTQLLAEEANDDNRVDSAVTPLLLFSIFIAVSGSLAYGAAAMGLSDVIGLLGWITISVSQEACSLYVGRFLVGASTGIFAYVVPVYVAEITPNNLRGGLVSLAPVMISAGVLVMFFVGSLIPWRILVLIGIVPSLVQLLGIFLIPESPRFLATSWHIILNWNCNFYCISSISCCSASNGYYEYILDRQIRKTTPSNGKLILICYLIDKRSHNKSLTDFCGCNELLLLSCGIHVLVQGKQLVGKYKSILYSSWLVGLFGSFPYRYVGNSICHHVRGRHSNLTISIKPFQSHEKLVSLCAHAYMVFSMDVKGSAGSLSAVVTSRQIGAFQVSSNQPQPPIIITKKPTNLLSAFFVLASINAFATLFVVKLVPETNGKTLEEILSFKQYNLKSTRVTGGINFFILAA
ncbi:hypothetical protein V2J09_001068 [Rumex salicifolius]